jgi:hypothetical protein
MRVRASAALAIGVLAASASINAEPGRGDLPPARLALMVTTAAGLPSGVRTAALREVSEIWKRQGITVSVVERASVDTPPLVRVLVVTAARSDSGTDSHQWPVAELLADATGRPMAVASIGAARRVLRAASLDDGPNVLVERRLGVVLGRAIAHEIGHHLLDSSGHVGHGLMRARIDARDFADPRDGGFDLDAAASARARARLRSTVEAPLVARLVPGR